MGKFYEQLLEGLRLYVRHGAWLDAVPGEEPKAKPRREVIDDVEMPDCEAMHIIARLYEIGPIINDAPITFSEISAWSAANGVDLEPWEFRFLRELSMAYLSESRHAVDPKRPPPYESGIAVSRRLLAQSLKDSIKGLAAL